MYIHLDSVLTVMFNYINLYATIHDVSVFIITVAVLMHEHVHSCLHLSIVNKTLFDILICYGYLFKKYIYFNFFNFSLDLVKAKPIRHCIELHI